MVLVKLFWSQQCTCIQSAFECELSPFPLHSLSPSFRQPSSLTCSFMCCNYTLEPEPEPSRVTPSFFFHTMLRSWQVVETFKCRIWQPTEKVYFWSLFTHQLDGHDADYCRTPCWSSAYKEIIQQQHLNELYSNLFLSTLVGLHQKTWVIRIIGKIRELHAGSKQCERCRNVMKVSKIKASYFTKQP